MKTPPGLSGLVALIAAVVAAGVALATRPPVGSATEAAYRRTVALLYDDVDGPRDRALAVPLRFGTALAGDSLDLIVVWGDLPNAPTAYAAGAVDSLSVGFLHAATHTNAVLPYTGYAGTWTVRAPLPPALGSGILGAAWPYTVCLAVKRTWPAQAGRVAWGVPVCAPMRWMERRAGDPVLRYFDDPVTRTPTDSLRTRTPA